MSTDRFKRLREPTFAVSLFTGMLVIALGVAFLILGATINTAPPAPYMNPSEKYLLVAISVIAIIGGLGMVRFAGKVVGW